MIDVMIITFNEAANLPDCLRALQGWVHKIMVIDSGSTDGTPHIAESFGATVIHHDWEGYAKQKNWGLRNLPFESPWVLLVDADEVITPKVRQELQRIASRPADEVAENGFFINRLTYFLGRPIRHCGFYPSWNLRFFKRGKGIYEEREVHEHVIIDHPVGYINEPMLHIDRRGLEHYIAKHNRYSTLEARVLFREIMGAVAPTDGHGIQPNLTRANQLNRWLKRSLLPWMPMPGLWRFLYMYVVRLGFLDGRAGLTFCRFICTYDYMLSLKLREALRQARQRDSGMGFITLSETGLAVHEGGESIDVAPVTAAPTAVDSEGDHTLATPLGDSPRIEQTHPEPSPWTFKEKLGRALWMLIGQPIFRLSFHNWHRFRCVLLRLYGAKLGRGVSIRPSASIEVPWMLEIDDHATIGDYAILYSLGPIRIGKRSIISQYTHLCAGTHDYSDPTFKLIRAPITIGNDVWIGTDAYVGPGVTIGHLSVVGARSSVYKDLPERKVCVGNPARPVKDRVLR